MFCSFAALSSKVIKVMNVYCELTPAKVKCQLIQALSVMTTQMYLILFIKIWAITSWKATTDKKYTSLELKDGWESLNWFLKCHCQIALDAPPSLNCKVAPEPLLGVLQLNSQGWVLGTYQKKKEKKKRKDMSFIAFWIYLWNRFNHYKKIVNITLSWQYIES